MKTILILLIFFELIYAINPIDYTSTWLTQEYKNFRAYPRVSRAYELIEEGNEKEAKVLLEKALTIDKNNKEAAHALITLCVKEKDTACINKYMKLSKNVNLGYYYIDKAQKAKESKDYMETIVFARQALNYKLNYKDKALIQLILFDAYLKSKQYKKADKFIGKKMLSTSNLLKWSEISDNLEENQYAYNLASELPNQVKYLEWQVNLLLKNKNYKKASKKMEALYLHDDSKENKTKLIHLYKLTNQNENILALYQKKLTKGCDRYALNYLLNHYKNNKKKRMHILEKHYPYNCLKNKKRTLLSLDLINYLKRTNPKKAQKLSKEITKNVEKLYAKNSSTKSQKQLISFYENSGEKHKIIKLHQKKLNHGCNKYSLRYLLNHYKNKPTKIEQLLEKNYPYACFPKKSKTQLTLQWIDILNQKDSRKLTNVLAELKKEELSASSYLNISNIYAHLGEHQKSIDYALAHLKIKPEDTLASKNIGFSYYKLGEKELALHYLFQAVKFNPKDHAILKNIGYLCSELKEYSTAIYYWNLYLKKVDDSEIQLEMASLYYFKLKEYDKANQELLSFESLTDDYNEKYYLLKAKLSYKNNNCKLAINNYDHALKSKYNESVNYEYIHLLQQCKEESTALVLMQKLQDKSPENLQYQKELAYMYQKSKNYPRAIKNFEAVTKKEPTEFQNHTSLAYAYKKNGQDKKAIQSFKSAVDNYNDNNKTYLRNIKREIHNGSKLFDIYMAQSFRLDSYDAKGKTSPINKATYAGFGNLRVSYKPKFLPKNTALFVDVAHNHKKVKKSLQPSIGISYKPLKKKNIVLSVQQMIKADKGTRSDTLLRASLGISSSQKTSSDIYQNLYLDSGYFVKNKSTVLYGNYEAGKVYTVNKNIDISPYITTGAIYNTDNPKKQTVTNLDIGLGVAISFKPDESKYKSAQYSNKLKLESRQKYAGNTKDKNTLRLQWEFFY